MPELKNNLLKVKICVFKVVFCNLCIETCLFHNKHKNMNKIKNKDIHK